MEVYYKDRIILETQFLLYIFLQLFYIINYNYYLSFLYKLTTFFSIIQNKNCDEVQDYGSIIFNK